jgi:hypothetical protein
LASRDWFRSETWNAQIEAEFEKRLGRSRTRFNKAQYLKIQGLTILASSETKAQEKGVQLLSRVVSDYPDQRTEVAHTHEILANYYKHAKNFAAAEAEYREVLVYYAVTPSRTNTTGLADISFVELILEASAASHYSEAETLLRALSEKARKHVMFNSDVFRYHAAFARLLSRNGKAGEAAQHARFALNAAQLRSPQFPRHPTVGLPKPTQAVLKELKGIANAAQHSV